MLTRLQAAGCSFNVEISGGRRIQPRNLLDLDLPRDTSDTVWQIAILLDPDVQSSEQPGWSGSSGRRSFAAQFAVFGALRREGRAELHASAIVPPDSTTALVLVAESGHGKSTLTLSAIAGGWGFLSDDLIAVFSNAAGDLTLAPLRRTLRVPESAVPLLPEHAREGRWNTETPRKMIVDPEACGLGPRHSRARPGRLVFLERGRAGRTVRPISSGEAFERLLLHSPHLAFDPDAKAAIGALRRLAAEVPGAVASLPLESLHDVATLEDLLA